MERDIWQLQEAKNKFSSLVKKAQKQGPQIVTKHGRKTVVVLSFDQYEKIVRPKTDIVTFFRNSPLSEINLKLSRNKDLPRKIEI